MKRSYILIPLVAIFMAGACKKTETIEKVEIIEEEAKPIIFSDSVSFYVNGKHYTTSPNYFTTSSGFGNAGVNLRLSDTTAEWGNKGPGNKFWVGAPDSVQYFTYDENLFGGGAIKFIYIKNYSKFKTMKEGMWYYPNIGKGFYQEGNYNFVVDHNHKNREEGIAIDLRIDDIIFSGTTYTQKFLNMESTLTAESQRDAHFKILKVEDIKGTDFVRIEGVFEANIFDYNEKKVFRITDGYFRNNVLKFGNRRSYSTK